MLHRSKNIFLYTTHLQIHATLYSSQGYIDELAWAALWLHKATGQAEYLAQAQEYYSKTKNFNPITDTFELNNKKPALAVLLSSSPNPIYRQDAKKFFDAYLNMEVQHTPRGLAYNYHWGAARHGANVAYLALVHAKNLKVPRDYANRLRNYAFFQVNYLLGDSGRSWIVGFGNQVNPWFTWHKTSYNAVLDWDLKLAEKVNAMPKKGPWSSALEGKEAPYIEKGKLVLNPRQLPSGASLTGC